MDVNGREVELGPADDVAHHWPSWRAQIAHHLPRFV